MDPVTLPAMDKTITEGSEALVAVSKLLCRTEAEYKTCSTFFAWAKARKKEIKEQPDWRDLENKITLLHGMHSEACALRKKVLEPYEKVEAKAEELMRPYFLKKKQEDDAEKRRLEAIAQKAAEEEKALLQLEAEIEGNTEEALILAELPAAVAPVKMEPAVPKQEGMRITPRFKWSITNLDLVPDTYWSLNEKLITQTVNINKEKTNIPGIKVVPDVGFGG